MKEEIINSLFELTEAKKMLSSEELGKEIAYICSKMNGGKWFSDDLSDYILGEEEYIGSLYKCKKEYSISKLHIEEKDSNGIPFVISFYVVYVLDMDDNVEAYYYLI